VRVPIEPPPTTWALPDPRDAATGEEIVAVGADLEPGTLVAAYRLGLFPMRVARGPIAWWSPDPRGVIPIDGLVVHRSLRRAARRFDVTVDSAFEEVVRGCADPERPHGWIDDDFIAAYTRLHELGWAHSIEVRERAEGSSRGRLVGGLYGVAIGGFFAGESMFHRVRDASKVALLATVARLGAGGGALFDVQWVTPHLASLGAVAIDRREYLVRLGEAIDRPQLVLTGRADERSTSG
jgi:leucyl/phenylalanyl-tRNA---protein transferase